MPGNIIRINNSDELEWYVGDSKMEKLIKYLNKIGFQRGWKRMERVKERG